MIRDHAVLDRPAGGHGGPLAVAVRGLGLLGSPLLNKDTAFTDEERDAFGLHGLLPPHAMTIEDQVELELEHARSKPDDLERYIGLAALQDRNETLFHRLLVEHLAEFLPIVYTPTVGRACQTYSHIMRRPRGVWITPRDLGRIDVILRAAEDRTRLLVVTDNERILGLGDQGAGGILIPVGKLALYTAAAGIHPSETLAVSLDVGTDRTDLLEDPLYLGYRAPRLRGPAYDEVVDAFVDAVERVCPTALVQWEDFKQHNAVRILARYRERVPSFNDDIQGTGAVVLAGLLAARGEHAGLTRDRFLILGAGAAAVGIAGLIQRELRAEGMSPDRVAGAIAMFDHRGLIRLGGHEIADDQRPFALDPRGLVDAGLATGQLDDAVAVAGAMGATVFIGVTGRAGAFPEPLVQAVGANHGQPIVLPLSNPTACAEATAEDILAWTGGRAIVATGSPSPDVVTPLRRHVVGQANNVFVFPGVGLGAIVAGATSIDDEVFLVAARELARAVREDPARPGAIYPPVGQLRQVTRLVATAVVRHFRDTGAGLPFTDTEIVDEVDRAMWWPAYRRYVPAAS